MKPVEQQNEYDEYTQRFFRLYETFSKSNYSIEIEHDSVKKVGDDPASVDNLRKIELKTGELFDLVICSLRLLRSSAVYRDHKIKSKSITFHPHGAISTSAPFLENMVVGKKCELSRSDTSMLKKIFEFLVNEKSSNFFVARRRLSGGVEKRMDEDRLLDYMIGLEALYLPDGNAELSFRLSLRIAYLLKSDLTERKELYEFVRNMYKTRSKIVHGSKYKLANEDIEKLESIL